MYITKSGTGRVESHPNFYTRPWFEAGEDYNVQQTEAGTYVVTQETGNELHGNYTIEIEIDLNEDQKPRIMSVNYQG